MIGEVETSEARSRARRIRDHMEEVWPLVIEAYQKRDWEALGYDSWEAYCREEIGRPIRLTTSERKQIHSEMADTGMSTRAIATVTGVTQRTVSNDLSGEKNFSPAPVTGLDGKTYTRPERDIEQTADNRQEPADEEEGYPSPEEVAANHDAHWLDAVRVYIEQRLRPLETFPPSPAMSEGLYRKRRQIIRHLLASYEEWLRQNGLT